MPDLLIAAAIDFSGGDWFRPDWDRIVSSLAMGKAGDIAQFSVPAAAFASRACGPIAPGRPPRVRRVAAQTGPDGSAILLAGRIMDKADLVRRFGLPPHLSDAQTYAALHARMGDACDNAITGDYAVIQWFAETRHLRLARSPISQNPLHVWRDGDRMLVATLARSIFAAGIPARIDDATVADQLLLNMRRATESWFEGIGRVASGTHETHDRGGSQKRRFWSLDSVKPVRFSRDEDYVEAVDEQFRRAVAANLEGVRQPALSLSGGLDSQALASYMVEHLGPGEQLRTYTAVPMAGWKPSGAYPYFGDESANVHALARLYPQISPTFADGAEARFGDRLDTMFLLGSCPTHNEMNMHWAHEIMARAADAGCDVLFGADAGNPGFSYSGLTGYPTWLRQGQWRRLLREVRLSNDNRPFWRKLLSMAIMPNLPLGLRIAIDRGRPFYPSAFATWCPLREDHARASGAVDRAWQDGHDFTFHHYPSARKWREEIVSAMCNEGPVIGIGLSLQHGITDRDPTAYRPLLELCMGIPDEQYLRDGETRWLARRLLKGRVPESVRTERRMGNQSADWTLRYAQQRPELIAQLESLRNSDRLAAIFDFDRMIADLRDWDGSDLAGERYDYRLTSLISRGIATARFVRYIEGSNAG